MKKTISILVLVLISISAFSQESGAGKPLGNNPYYRSPQVENAWSPKLSESQCEKLYQLLSAGKIGIFDSNQISAASAKNISMFGDSLINVMAAEYRKWHPTPPSKTDSTSNKKP